jgi:hypothetical protein
MQRIVCSGAIGVYALEVLLHSHKAEQRLSVPRATYHTRTTPMVAVRGVRRESLRGAGAANGLYCGLGGLIAGCAGTTDEPENHGVPGSNPGPATS